MITQIRTFSLNLGTKNFQTTKYSLEISFQKDWECYESFWNFLEKHCILILRGKGNPPVQSFPHESYHECCKKFTSRLWPCYLHLYTYFFTYILLFCCKIKTCCHHCFPLQIRPQTTIQPYILHDYSSVRFDFIVIN